MAALGRKFQVVRVIVLPADNDQILDAPGNVKLPSAQEAEIPRTKKRAFAARELGVKRFFRFFWTPPVSGSHARARYPDFADSVDRQLLRGRGIHNSNVQITGGASAAHYHDFVIGSQRLRDLILLHR